MTIKPIINDDFVLYLPLNEGTGTTTYDYSGNGNNGTLINTPSWQKNNFGGSYQLDFNGSNQGVDLSSSFNLAQDFTINIWVKLDALSTYTLVGKDTNTGTRAFWWIFRGAASNTDQFAYFGTDSSFNYLNTSGTTITSINTWYMLTVKQNSAGISFYVDGILHSGPGYTSGGYKDPRVGSTALTFAYRQYSGAESYLNGQISEGRIWNKSLSAEEIKAIYNNTYRT